MSDDGYMSHRDGPVRSRFLPCESPPPASPWREANFCVVAVGLVHGRARDPVAASYASMLVDVGRIRPDTAHQQRFAQPPSSVGSTNMGSGLTAELESLIEVITGRVVVLATASLRDPLERRLVGVELGPLVLACDQIAEVAISDVDDPANVVGLVPDLTADSADATVLIERVASLAQIFVALVSLLDRRKMQTLATLSGAAQVRQTPPTPRADGSNSGAATSLRER